MPGAGGRRDTPLKKPDMFPEKREYGGYSQRFYVGETKRGS